MEDPADVVIHTFALCAGLGGLELGARAALNGRTRLVGVVERQAYCAAALVARMEEAAMDRAPIWNDLTSVDGRAWRGVVDLVCAGFPCQPASYAGKRSGTADERWLWPDVWRFVTDSGADWLFVENVAGLLTVNGGAAFGEILGSLAELGWNAEWGVFTAAGTGAPHVRRRVYLLGHSPNTDGNRLQSVRRCGEQDRGERPALWHHAHGCDGSHRQRWREVLGRPEPEPAIRRMDDGVPGGMGGPEWADALHALGNSVEWHTAERAFVNLLERLASP